MKVFLGIPGALQMVTFSQGVLESHHGKISERFSFQSERLDAAERSKQAEGCCFFGMLIIMALFGNIYGIYNLYMLCIYIFFP